MSAPLTSFAQEAFDWLEPVQNDDPQGVLAAICGGIGEMFREVEELVRVRPGRQPWQQAFDIDTCPDFQIPWLGQMVGVGVVTGVSADAQRAQVKAEAGFWRGTVTGLLGAVIQTLTGSRRLHLTERSSDAWTMLLTTDTRDTPHPTLTNNAAQAAKAAALLLTVSQTTVPLIDEGTRTIDASAGVINTATLANIT